MDAIIIPILTIFATLLGVIVTAFIQTRNQRANHSFQLESDSSKHKREQTDRDKTDMLRRLTDAHKLLTKLGREFSIDNLDILWRKKMTDVEYGKHYLFVCEDLDELRAFASLHASMLQDDIEYISAQASIFRGNFDIVLYATQNNNNNIDHNSSSLQNAHKAANEIGMKVNSAKSKVVQLASFFV
jgi:hypothetical protein